MYKRILVIGDIHGEWDKFQSLYEKIGFTPPDDLLIFLGDYIDRGPKPLQVLDWMMAHEEEANIIMLRGNHEQMMLDPTQSQRQRRRNWAGRCLRISTARNGLQTAARSLRVVWRR